MSSNTKFRDFYKQLYISNSLFNIDNIVTAQHHPYYDTVASSFHQFHVSRKIKRSDYTVGIELSGNKRFVLANGLSILGVAAPEKM